MMSYRLSLLGTPILEINGKRIVFPRKKCIALIAYIAAEGAVSRDALAALLWPESDARLAGGSLRGALHTITALLGEGALALDHDIVGLSENGVWDIDLRAFEPVFGRIEHGEMVTEEDIERAVGLYRGEFMCGFGLSDSARFDDWQGFMSGRYRGMLRRMLSESIERNEEAGKGEEAIALGRRLVAMDELAEESQRVLMRLYARAGKKREALKQYERCVKVLGEELGDKPGWETVALKRRIEANELEPMPRKESERGPAEGKRDDPPVPPESVFVGREGELESMRRTLSQVIAGWGWVDMIRGEAGIGKTRLVGEFAREAAERGVTVLSGSGYKGLGVPPLWPWTQVLREYVERTGREQAEEELGPWTEYVSMIVPELSSGNSGGIGGGGHARQYSQNEQFLFFNAVCEFLVSASKRTPLLIVLDDLQWADAASLSLVGALAREIERSRLYVVGVFREQEFERSHAVTAMIGELARIDRYRSRVLRGFTAAETGEYVAVLAPGLRGKRGLTEEIHALTEGNPLYIRHLAPLVAVTGTAGLGHDGSVRLPPGLKEAIGSRIGELSDGCIEVLETASLMGLEFPVDQLVKVMEAVPAESVLKGLDEGVGQRIVEWTEKREVLRFSHELVRDGLSAEIPPSVRMKLHARIGTVLEELYAGDVGAHAAEILHHYAHAPALIDGEKRAELALEAAKRAVEAFEYNGALSYIETGLEAIGERAMGSTKARLLMYRGAVPRTDDPEHSHLAEDKIDDILTAFRFFEQTTEAEMLAAMGALFTSSSSWEAHAYMKEQMLRPDGLQSEKWRAIVSVELSNYKNMRSGSSQESMEFMEYARRTAEKINDPLLSIYVNQGFGRREFDRGNYGRYLYHVRRVIELCESSGYSRFLFTYRFYECGALGMLRRFEEQERVFGKLLQEEKASDPICGRRVELERARIEADHGNPEKARRILGELRPWKKSYFPNFTVVEVLVEYNAGEYERGRECIRELLEYSNAKFYPLGIIEGSLHAARILWEEDLLAPAVSVAEEIMADPSVIPRLRTFLQAFLAIAAVNRNETERAAGYYRTLSTGTLDRGPLIAGYIAMKIGRLEEALEHLELCLAEPVYRKLDYIWGLCYRGEVLLERDGEGDRAEAERNLAEALSLAEGCGMKAAAEFAKRVASTPRKVRNHSFRESIEN